MAMVAAWPTAVVSFAGEAGQLLRRTWQVVGVLHAHYAQGRIHCTVLGAYPGDTVSLAYLTEECASLKCVACCGQPVVSGS